MKEIYGWVPWFGELAGKIAEGGETYLAEAAKRVAWRDDDDEQPLPLLKHGDENIDPFSFFYSLAQRGQDAGSRMRIFPSINKEFNMERQPPMESDDAFVFPTPSYRAQVLFHNNGQGNPQLLWNLFRGALRGLDSVDPEDFVGALKIGYVGRVKLTQVLFLINPSQFIACDDKMAPFVNLPTGELDWAHYKEWVGRIRKLFPGCEPYEINLFAYLRWSRSLPVHSDRCFQVSTNAWGQDGGDFWTCDAMGGPVPVRAWVSHLLRSPSQPVFAVSHGAGVRGLRHAQFSALPVGLPCDRTKAAKSLGRQNRRPRYLQSTRVHDEAGHLSAEGRSMLPSFSTPSGSALTRRPMHRSTVSTKPICISSTPTASATDVTQWRWSTRKPEPSRLNYATGSTMT